MAELDTDTTRYLIEWVDGDWRLDVAKKAQTEPVRATVKQARNYARAYGAKLWLSGDDGTAHYFVGSPSDVERTSGAVNRA